MRKFIVHLIYALALPALAQEPTPATGTVTAIPTVSGNVVTDLIIGQAIASFEVGFWGQATLTESDPIVQGSILHKWNGSWNWHRGILDLSLELQKASLVTVEVFSAKGEALAIPLKTQAAQGNFSTSLNFSELGVPSGVAIVLIRAGQFQRQFKVSINQ